MDNFSIVRDSKILFLNLSSKSDTTLICLDPALSFAAAAYGVEVMNPEGHTDALVEFDYTLYIVTVFSRWKYRKPVGLLGRFIRAFIKIARFGGSAVLNLVDFERTGK